MVWFDRRSHHLVTFPGSETELAGTVGWAEALALMVKDGRARKLEVRKVNGGPLDPASPWAAQLIRAGFVASYRGLALHG